MRTVVFELGGPTPDTREGQHPFRQDADELLAILRRLGFNVAAFAPGTGASFTELLNAMQVTPSDTVLVSNNIASVTEAKQVHSAKVIGLSYELNSAQALLDAGADHIVTNIATVLDVLE
jgi:phosphoglycolate phosphatase-like HAD superfamily hydrolase